MTRGVPWQGVSGAVVTRAMPGSHFDSDPRGEGLTLHTDFFHSFRGERYYSRYRGHFTPEEMLAEVKRFKGRRGIGQ